MLRRVGEHTAPTGMQGGGSSPEALGTPPSSALCSAADAAVSDTHSEVGLQLDHRVRPLLPFGHHRPPVAKLSQAHERPLLCSHPSSSLAHPPLLPGSLGPAVTPPSPCPMTSWPLLRGAFLSSVSSG